MRYVMVPVPREYVLDVMRWVLFRAPDGDFETEARDSARVMKLLNEVDEPGRSLLVLIANAAVETRPLLLSDAAVELGLAAADMNALIKSLNRVALGEGREVIEIRAEPAIGVRGHKGTTTYLGMPSHIARHIRTMAGTPHASEH